jgi:hypothetical protein
MHICSFMKASKVIVRRMSSKETPKKVYRAFTDSAIDPSSCRLCRAVGDAGHRKNIFKPSNQALLKIAEQLCGHPIVQDSSLPHLLCRPCERRLNHTLEFQKVIVETEKLFQQRQSSVRVKRCIDVSPSVSRQPKSLSRRNTRPSSRTSLDFGSCQDVSSIQVKHFIIVVIFSY